MQQTDWASIESLINQKDADWKKREGSLQLLADRLAKKDKYAMDVANRNAKGVALQLNDLRSALVKLASLIVERFAENANEMNMHGMEKFGECLMREPNFIKAIGSANKVINNHAANAFRALYEHNQINLTALEGFYTSNKDSKNNNIRERISEGLYMFLNTLNINGDKQLNGEGIDFLKKAIETMMRDASGPVRGYAKIAKESLNSHVNGLGTKILSGADKDKLRATKTIARSIETKRAKDSHSVTLDQKKTVPILKQNKSKVSSIENNQTVGIGNFDNGNVKTGFKKNVHKISILIEIVEDSQKSVKDKIDQLASFDLVNISCPCTITEYERLLKQILSPKNSQLDKILSMLIESIKISEIVGKLLEYIENNRLDKKESCTQFMNKVLNEDISSFIHYFMLKNNDFSLRMLLRKFDVDGFDSFIKHKPDVVPSLLSIICQNMSEKNSDNFLASNVSLLEQMYQSRPVYYHYKNYQFSESFFETLQKFNFGLYKFLLNHQKKLGDKTFAPLRVKEQLDVNKKKTQELQHKHTVSVLGDVSDTRKLASIVPKKSIVANPIPKKEGFDELLARLEDAEISVSVSNKKTAVNNLLEFIEEQSFIRELSDYEPRFLNIINLLKGYSKNEFVDNEMFVLIFKLLGVLYEATNQNGEFAKSIATLLFEMFCLQPQYRDRIVVRILDGNFRLPVFNYLMVLVRSTSVTLVVDTLKFLTTMVKLSKKAHSYLIFHKEVAQRLDDITMTTKELFVSLEVGIRKNVVHLLVEFYFFMDHNVFPRLIGNFSTEQQKLVEIYIEKVTS